MIQPRHTIRLVVLAIAALSSWSEIAAADLGFGYVRQGDKIHFEGGGKTGKDSTVIDEPSNENIDGFSHALDRLLPVCQSLDVASFEALSEEYTRDKNMVHYKWISPGRFLVIQLPQADVASFKPLNFTHAVDKNTIWYLDLPLEGSDPDTAQLIDNRIIKDAKQVYISGEPQPQLDAKTFRSVGSAYYVDANGVHWGGEPVADADAATFKVLDDSFFAVDEKSVYRSGERLPHLDAGSCQLILSDPYGYQVVSDKNGVYLNGLKFLHADPADFTKLDQLTCRDDKHIFLVDTWHSTPITVYRDEGRTVVETILYETKTKKPLAIIKAEVTDDKLKNITLAPPPGQDKPLEVPAWQRDVFQRPDLVKRMHAAGELLK